MAPRSWSASDEAELRRLYPKLPVPEVARRLNRTQTAVRSRAKVLGVTRGRRRRYWTPEEDGLLRTRYAREFTKAIAADLGRPTRSVYQRAAALGLRKDPDWVAENCRGLDPESGRDHRFRKGQAPPNKGVKGWDAGGRSVETRFKPGARPHTWVPVGTEVTDRDGYRKRKIRDDAPTGMSRFNWQFVHILIWEAANGPVPKGHAVVFVNGDKADLRLENLELVSRRELMRRNTLHRYPKPLVDTIRAKGVLTRKINQLKDAAHGKEQDRRSA